MDIRKEIREIKGRNKRVETDKAWEMSLTRKVIISILTYLIIVIFFFAANLPNPWLNALVPTLAFILSTATLPLFKNIWIRLLYKKR